MKPTISTYLETIRAVDGEVYHLEYHQKRYEKVLTSFGVSEFKNLQDYLNPPSSGLYRCRVVYSLDKVDVTYHAYKKRDINSLKLVYDETIEYSKKSTDRKNIDKLFDMRDKCDDILIVQNSLVKDTSIANVAFYNSGVWYTPSKPLLNGTTRQRLLDEGKIIEEKIKVQDLQKYSKVALLNAMIDFDIIRQYDLKDVLC
jgi:4-amino-4-deoxychorismate lyase